MVVFIGEEGPVQKLNSDRLCRVSLKVLFLLDGKLNFETSAEPIGA